VNEALTEPVLERPGAEPRSEAGRQRLEQLWAEHAAAVHAYVRRRAPDLADEVCSETFVVACRRLDRVPRDARAWLLGVASNVLRTRRRSDARRTALAVRLERESPSAEQPVELADGAIAAALASLRALDRELVLLVYWDDLAPASAARVVGVPAAVARTRLWRARRQLRQVLEDGSGA
jgi:RNA polymerase sigma-70 factor (ECF subfamily)